MKLSKKLIGRTLLIIVLILGLKLAYDNFISSKAIIQRVSGVNFPTWTSTIQTVKMEFANVGKYQIPISKIDQFIAENDFQVVRNTFDITIGFLREFTEANRPDKSSGTWMRHKDCNDQNHWDFLLNKDTGEIWAIAIFPDWGGDMPKCQKANN